MIKVDLNKPLKPNLQALTEYLDGVNERGWFTNFGPLEQLLTERLSEYLGVENLLLVSNGTVALEVAAKTLGCRRVVTTPFSFVATASAFQWVGCELSFSDIDRATYNLCPRALTSSKIYEDRDTLLATHVFGNPCEVEALDGLTENVIYDASHAFGIELLGRSVLSYGDASTLSFHATKVFHTVEGGAIVFKRDADLAAAKRLINFAKRDSNSDVVGINGKLSEVHAAVGLTLLSDIDLVLERRSELYERYKSKLSNYVEVQQWHEQANFNGAYFPVHIGDDCGTLEQGLQEDQVFCRRYFKPPIDEILRVDTLLPNSSDVTRGILCLPLHAYLTNEQLDYVCERVLARIQ